MSNDRPAAATHQLSIGLRLRRELLPARFELDAAPLQDVRDLGAGAYESTGVAPQLELRSRAKRWPRGWVDLTFELQIQEQHKHMARPCIYLGADQGDEEGAKVSLPYPVGGVIRLHLWLPPGMSKIRLAPIEGAGRWRLGRLSLMELGKLRAGIRFASPVLRQLLREPARLPAAAAGAWRVFRTTGLPGIKQKLIQSHRGPKDYATWIRQFDTLTLADRAAIETSIAGMTRRPRFSVVMPVYNTPEPWLRRAIDSVQSQLYPDWELCIADDASTARHLRPLLESAARDPRVKVAFRASTGHISAASNSALALATGDYVALLDHDDELAPHALYMVAEELSRHPDADLVYSDEDKLDEEGRRYDPYFKPDFNPELLWSHNFFSHLGIYRTSLIRELGGFRVGFEGSQDYDLVLRALRRTQPSRIRHIPHVLYHWRAVRGSAAAATDAKPYAFVAAQRSLSEHLAAEQPGSSVGEGRFPGTYRVKLILPADPPLVSVIIPTRDALDMVRRCVDTLIAKTDYRSYELIIVDNQSTDPAAIDWLQSVGQRGSARILSYDRPFNYSAINNFAASAARGSILCLLNNDVEPISPGWLTELVSHVVRPEIGVVGGRLLYPDGRVQHAGIASGVLRVAAHLFRGIPREAPGYFGQAHLLRASSAVTGACLVLRRSLFQEVGGLDEKELAIAFNDVDLCLKVQQRGYRNLFTPWAELYHFESYSRGDDMAADKRSRFNREIKVMLARYPELASDPFYNPNLSLESDQMDLAFPPRARRPW